MMGHQKTKMHEASMETPTIKLQLLTAGVLAWTMLATACICCAEIALP